VSETVLRTNAWDLVAAIRQQTLNQQFQALYSEGRLIKELTETVQLPFVGDAKVTLKLGAPTLKFSQTVPNLVEIRFPITGGTLTTKMGTIPVPTKGLSLTVVTDLQYVHLRITNDKTRKEQDVLRLAINFSSPESVYNVDMEGNPPGWDPDYNPILSAALRKKLQQDAARTDYDHPYHIADIVLPEGTPKGLEPTDQADFTTQIVDHSDAGDQNIIALLMTTAGDRRGTSNNFANSPALVPKDHVSSLLIGNEVLMKKMIVPQVADGLKLKVHDFKYSGGGAKPTKASLNGHPYLGGKYKIYLWDCDVKVDGGRIVVDYEAHAHPLVDTKETFYIKVTGNVKIKPELKRDKNGKQQIVFTGSHSDPSGKVECDWWVYAIVVAAILVTFGTLSLLFAAVAAVVVTVLMATLTFNVDMPSDIKTMLAEGLSSYAWPAEDDITLDGVDLPGDLVITGVPHL